MLLPPRLQWWKILQETLSAVLADLPGDTGGKICLTSQVDPLIPGVRDGAGFAGNKRKNQFNAGIGFVTGARICHRDTANDRKYP